MSLKVAYFLPFLLLVQGRPVVQSTETRNTNEESSTCGQRQTRIKLLSTEWLIIYFSAQLSLGRQLNLTTLFSSSNSLTMKRKKNYRFNNVVSLGGERTFHEYLSQWLMQIFNKSEFFFFVLDGFYIHLKGRKKSNNALQFLFVLTHVYLLTLSVTSSARSKAPKLRAWSS